MVRQVLFGMLSLAVVLCLVPPDLPSLDPQPQPAAAIRVEPIHLAFECPASGGKDLHCPACEASPSVAASPDVEQEPQEAPGARWRAGRTSVSALSLEQKRRLCSLKGFPQGMEGERMEPGQYTAQFDWRDSGGDWTTPIREQGECGSCWAFGSLAAVEAMINIGQDDPDLDWDLSEQFLLSCTEGGCQGWFLDKALDFLLDTGTPEEACLTYQADDTLPCDSACPDWQEKAWRITDWGWVSPEIENIKAYLTTYGPLMTGMDVYVDFTYYTGGVYQHLWGEHLGEHAITIVGYNEGEDCWVCKNSWGPDWGEDGWFRIRYGECGIEYDTAYIEGVRPPWESRTITVHNDGDRDLVVDDIRISHQLGERTGWLDASPRSFTVPPGGWRQVTVETDCSRLGVGRYHGWLDILSNDPERSPAKVTVTVDKPNSPPRMPDDPSPSNHESNVSSAALLSWTGGDPDLGDAVTYDIYLGTSASPPLVCSAHPETTYDPGPLDHNTTYYWQIIATDSHGSSNLGPLWDFTVEPFPPPLPHAFWGDVAIGEQPAPVGTTVSARVAGEEYGTISTTEVGKYGSPDPLGPKLIVQGYIEDGETIDFYIEGIKAEETFPFHSGEVTRLDLVTPPALLLRRGVNLVAYFGATCDLPQGLTNIGPQGLDVVTILWHRNSDSGEWLWFDPELPEVSTLHKLEYRAPPSSRTYIIIVTRDCFWAMPQ